MDSAVKISLNMSGIIPTADRPLVLKRTLESIAEQHYQPEEIIIIDASEDDSTEKICSEKFDGLIALIKYQRAQKKGAAEQRNQGLANSKHAVVYFLDDDIKLEEGCVQRLWDCLQSDKMIGAVNAMVTNQQYHTPGKLTRFMYRLMSGQNLSSYAGKCIGPAWNLLPEDKPALPECNQVEWVNTTCTLYKKEAMPVPAFGSEFQGYSLLEDLSLSLQVGKKWKLYNARTARIFHDSQPGKHKNNIKELAKMELVNRHYIMTTVLGRSSFKYYCKLFIFELFGVTVVLTNIAGWKRLFPVLAGKFTAIGAIIRK